jgi:SAM-dependent methyltransferase
MGPELFLLDRAFDECLDRLRDFSRRFDHALILGCPSPEWPDRLSAVADKVEIVDPGALFASQAAGAQIEEDRHDYGIAQYDLCVAVGTLDSVNDLPSALQLIRRALKPDSPLIGAIAGADTLPVLRGALIEAGRIKGRVVARTHPRIEAATFAQLLIAAGFGMPVVDVDRVQLRYASLDALIGDLRAMGATSVLARRSPPMSKRELQLARRAFEAQKNSGRTAEFVEILHFLGWSK